MAKKSKDTDNLIVNFKYSKSTKGAHVFQEIDDDGDDLVTSDKKTAIGALYLRKDKIGEKEPKSLTVTVELEY